MYSLRIHHVRGRLGVSKWPGYVIIYEKICIREMRAHLTLTTVDVALAFGDHRHRSTACVVGNDVAEVHTTL